MASTHPRPTSPSCPRCHNVLSDFEHQGIAARLCPRCRGVFLGGASLRRQFGAAAEVFSAAQGVAARGSALPCPVGCGALRPFDVPSRPRPVAVDVCPTCGGAWFDAGEVQAVAAAGVPGPPRRAPRPQGSPRSEGAPKAAPDDLALAENDEEPAAGWYLLATVAGLPLEGYNPVYRRPWVTYALVVLCSVVFVAQWQLGSGVIDRFGLVPRLLVTHGDSPARVFVSMFLHGDLVHLLGNLYFLKVFGDNVEDRLGRGVFAAFYLACGLGAASLYVLLARSSTVPAIGSSGAIAGALGGYLVFFPRARVRLVPVLSVVAGLLLSMVHLGRMYSACPGIVVAVVLLCALPFLALYARGNELRILRPIQLRAAYFLPLWFFWQVVSALRSVGGVAWWAHVGGFVTGVLLALGAKRWLPDPRRVERDGVG